jgi:tetratricopeptide (TPR) repeat protein
MDPYCGALAQSLAERLEVHPQLRPAYGANVLADAVPPVSDEDAGKLARGMGARFVIAGAFDRDAQWQMHITERLLLVDGDTAREIARADGKGDKDALQELVAQVAVELLAKGARPLPPDLAATVTRKLSRDNYAFFLWGKALAHIHGYGKSQKDLKKAEEYLRKASLIDPKFAEGHRLRGWVYLEQGQMQKARGEYSYALELKKDYYLPLIGLVRMYRQSGSRTQALDLVKHALEIRPGDTEARFIYGELLYEDGKLDDAYAELKRVVAAQPRNIPARKALVLIHAARGAGEELAQELEGLVALDPDDINARLDLASAYQRIGETDKAITAYQGVLEHNGRHVAATKFLGDLYRGKGDFDKAADQYRAVMKLAPNDPRPYFLLGSTYVEAGRDGKAEAIFQEAQRFGRYSPEAWNNLGAISYRKGDISKALVYLERAVQKLPRRPKVHYNLGLALSAAQKRDRALTELRMAASLDPEDAEIRYALGVVLLRQGHLDEAAREFREAVNRKPDHQDALHNLAILEELQRRIGEGEILSPSLVGEPKNGSDSMGPPAPGPGAVPAPPAPAPAPVTAPPPAPATGPRSRR